MSFLAAVIFDVDGVLVDSYEPHFIAWQQIAVEHGRVCTREDFVAGFGRTTREVLRDQWADLNLTEEELHAIDLRKEDLYREIVRENFPAIPGTRELIRALREAGWKMAIGSSGPPANVQVAVDGLDLHEIISVRINGRMVKEGKPHPEIFLTAAAGIDMPPSRCVVIEDAPVGVEAAHRAGMKVLGLASTGRTVAELHAADRVVETLCAISPADLAALLDG